ncbi:hypothetical protein KR084_007755 [Drosophila pseudotakahashii]|nr:hypothetical protein KR084_007755 [Drosophila pseudotakahashii]
MQLLPYLALILVAVHLGTAYPYYDFHSYRNDYDCEDPFDYDCSWGSFCMTSCFLNRNPLSRNNRFRSYPCFLSHPSSSSDHLKPIKQYNWHKLIVSVSPNSEPVTDGPITSDLPVNGQENEARVSDPVTEGPLSDSLDSVPEKKEENKNALDLNLLVFRK